MDPAETEALVRAVDADLDGVDRALRRLDDGDHGTCERCGRPLPDAALEADPLRTHCPDPCAG